MNVAKDTRSPPLITRAIDAHISGEWILSARTTSASSPVPIIPSSATPLKNGRS